MNIALSLPAAVALLIASPAWANAPVFGDRPLCVRANAEARLAALGFDHLVRVENGCGGPVTCDVSTDVAPTPVHVHIPSGQHADLVTFRGSPSREFSAIVACTIDGDSPYP